MNSQYDDDSFTKSSKEVASLKYPTYHSTSICWLHDPVIPWDLGWYFSIRGAESLHLYLWMLKDLSWTQDWFVSGYVFGILALLWGVFILNHAVHHRNIKEIWTTIGQLLWLGANFWWMCGEIHDFNYPDDPPQYPQRTIDARHVMEAALVWLGLYYAIIKPFKILSPTKESENEYNLQRLKPRLLFIFSTWREYENAHILFWLGKDYGWNLQNSIVWIIFVIPTTLIACDFMIVSLFDRQLLVEHAHYIAQFLWVLANMVWALGEIWYPQNDYPFNLFSKSRTRLITTRWYSSWILVASFVPIVALYLLWNPIRKSWKQREYHQPKSVSSLFEVANPVHGDHVQKIVERDTGSPSLELGNTAFNPMID